MRYLFLLICCFISLSIFSQQNIEDNFEGDGTIAAWIGDDCGVNSSYSNPHVEGINTSNTVLKYSDSGGQYANVRFDTNENLDLSVKNTFTFKIYVPSNGLTGNQTNKVSLKLQDGNLAQPWSTQSEIIKSISLDQWQEVSFDFENDSFINLTPTSPPPTTRTDFNRVLIQVNGEDNYDHVIAYIDDFIYEESTYSEPVFTTLVWSDEFNGSGAVDSNKWHHQTIPIINGQDWANGELQHYTDQTANSYVSNGTLKIRAIKGDYIFNNVTKPYTSARLNSKAVFRYGRIDVRAKLPAEAGTWPAIWTLGANINELGNYFGSTYGSVGWPSCGEIDIMEQNGWDKTNLIGHLHYTNATTNTYQNEGSTTYIANSSGEFHVYSLIWTQDIIQILLDNTVFFEKENTQEIPYDNQHYLLLNIAMGGNLGGSIPSDFFDAIMEIDYVRIFEESSLTSSTIAPEDIIVYPNPTENIVAIKIPAYLVGTNAVIYSLLGQELDMFTIDSKETSLDMSLYDSGVYFLKFESNLGVTTKQIIKK